MTKNKQTKMLNFTH